MSLQEDILPYLTKAGNVALSRFPQVEEDNIHLFNATYVALLTSREGVKASTYPAVAYIQYVRSCNIYKDSQPGLYRRSPDNYWRIISHDEMIGISFMSQMLSIDMVAYGRANSWCFDNRVPGIFTLNGWQRRFLAPIPYYKARAQENINLFDKLSWALDTIITATRPYGDTSGKCLTYLMSLDMVKEGWICRKAVEFFRKKMAATYGDLGGLYAVYFGDHPLATYAKGIGFDGKGTLGQ